MKTNQILTGDCVEHMKKLSAASVDLVYADPPYNLSGNGLKWRGSTTGGDWDMINEAWDQMSVSEYADFTQQWIDACHRLLKPHGAIYISCAHHNLGEVMTALKKSSFKINNVITWHKTNAMPNMTRRVYTHTSEFVIWAVKGKKWIFNYEELKKINPDRQQDGSLKQMRDVWTMPLVQGKERLRGQDGKALHPTQKSEEMLRRIIIASSNPNGLVLDPFLGSGTTAVVAKKLGRQWIGIESDKRYLESAKKRIARIRALKNSTVSR